MATGIKGICFNESSQLNSVDFKQHSHIRKFCDGTRHFTRLSSTIFDDVIYESIYGVSGMTDDIMGASSKRYSSIIADSGRTDIKRRSIDIRDTYTSNVRMVGVLREKKTEDILMKEQPPDIQEKNLKNLVNCSKEKENVAINRNQNAPKELLEETVVSNKEIDTNVSLVDNVKQQNAEQTEVISLPTETSDNNLKENDSQPEAKNNRFRSNSDCIGRTPRNSNQVDITSTPLYKEIYANNLRQYGFLLAKVRKIYFL